MGYEPYFPFHCEKCNTSWRVTVDERDTGDPFPKSDCWVCGEPGERGLCCGMVNSATRHFS